MAADPVAAAAVGQLMALQALRQSLQHNLAAPVAGMPVGNVSAEAGAVATAAVAGAPAVGGEAIGAAAAQLAAVQMIEGSMRQSLQLSVQQRQQWSEQLLQQGQQPQQQLQAACLLCGCQAANSTCIQPSHVNMGPLCAAAHHHDGCISQTARSTATAINTPMSENGDAAASQENALAIAQCATAQQPAHKQKQQPSAGVGAEQPATKAVSQNGTCHSQQAARPAVDSSAARNSEGKRQHKQQQRDLQQAMPGAAGVQAVLTVSSAAAGSCTDGSSSLPAAVPRPASLAAAAAASGSAGADTAAALFPLTSSRWQSEDVAHALAAESVSPAAYTPASAHAHVLPAGPMQMPLMPSSVSGHWRGAQPSACGVLYHQQPPHEQVHAVQPQQGHEHYNQAQQPFTWAGSHHVPQSNLMQPQQPPFIAPVWLSQLQQEQQQQHSSLTAPAHLPLYADWCAPLADVYQAPIMITMPNADAWAAQQHRRSTGSTGGGAFQGTEFSNAAMANSGGGEQLPLGFDYGAPGM